jgi:hypothetical protein
MTPSDVVAAVGGCPTFFASPTSTAVGKTVNIMGAPATSTRDDLRARFDGKQYRRHVLVTDASGTDQRLRRAIRDAIDAGCNPDSVSWETIDGAALDMGTNILTIGKGYNMVVITGERASYYSPALHAHGAL